MDVVETRAALRAADSDAARATGRTVGLVPTMGALHAGHLSLIARARAECDVVVVSIFVNPLQFGDPDDIANYPRTLERDLPACTGAGADLVFVPSVAEMYPDLARAAGHHRLGVRGERRLGGRLAAGSLRRRGHGRGQAVRHRRPLPGLLRPQGLPAAGRGAPHGARPLAAGRGRGVSHCARGRRTGPLEPQRAPGPRRAGRRHRAVAGPGRRPGRRRRRASARRPRSTS